MRSLSWWCLPPASDVSRSLDGSRDHKVAEYFTRATAHRHPGPLVLPERPQRIGVDGRSLPPFLVRGQLEDREVQVRRAGGSVAGRPDIADTVALLEDPALRQPLGVAVEVGVVVRIRLAGIELIDGQAAGGAREQLF